jgi:hypothetical protein
MLQSRFAAREPLAPAHAGKLRRGLLTAIVAVSLAAGAALAPIAGAAPVTGSHVHPYGQCPGVQIGC